MVKSVDYKTWFWVIPTSYVLLTPIIEYSIFGEGSQTNQKRESTAFSIFIEIAKV